MSLFERRFHQTIVEHLCQSQVHFNKDDVYNQLRQLIPIEHLSIITNNLEQLLESHISISDTDIQRIFHLTNTSITDYTNMPDGTQQFYIRSWTLSSNDACEILAFWEEEDVQPPLTKILLNQLDTNTNDQPIHIRYIGTCRSPVTPLIRHQQDSERGISLSSPLGEFIHALQHVNQQIFSSCQVFEFRPARLPPNTNQFIIDLWERTLIAIFQQSILLNRQHGGFYASYEPSEYDRQLFVNLNTTFFNDFSKRATAPPNNMESDLKNWIQSIHNYVTQNKQLTKTDQYPLNHSALTTILEQARPRTINGKTIIVLVGDDLPLSFFNSDVPYQAYLSGYSRAGYITQDFLTRLQSYEESNINWDLQELDTTIFPFVDMYPWIGKENTFDGATLQLRSYFYAVRPLITVAFSRKVTKVALANFYSQHGILNAQFLDTVGIPTLQTFASEDWLHDDNQQTPPQATLTVVIPHFHSGRDKYGKELPAMRHLMDITWMITIFIAEFTMDIATYYPQEHDSICRIITERCHKDYEHLDERLGKLYDELDEAKENFMVAYNNELQYRRTARITLPTTIRQQYARETMDRHGIAEGEPFSTNRQHQVNYLWKKNDRCLHIHIGRNEEERWREWAMKLSNGTHFLASAMNLAVHNIPNRHRLAHILKQFAPPDVTDDDWMNDDNLCNEALISWGKRAAIGLTGLSLQGEERRRYISQQQRRRVVGDDSRLYIYDYQSIMEGRDVTVRENGAVGLRWIDPNGEQVDITMRISLYVVELLGSRRLRVQLRFLEDGIGLQHGQQFFQAPKLTAEQGVLPQKRFFTQENGFRLDELWRLERKRIMGIDEPMDIVEDGVERGVKRGRDMFRSGTSERTIIKFGKIKEGDQVWPLLQWLREFGDDGIVTTAPPAYQDRKGYPQLSVDFLEYLNEYHVNHPYYHAWVTSLCDIKLNGKHIIKNIKYIRTNVETREIQVRNNPTLKSYRRIQFGPESERI